MCAAYKMKNIIDEMRRRNVIKKIAFNASIQCDAKKKLQSPFSAIFFFLLEIVFLDLFPFYFTFLCSFALAIACCCCCYFVLFLFIFVFSVQFFRIFTFSVGNLRNEYICLEYGIYEAMKMNLMVNITPLNIVYT